MTSPNFVQFFQPHAPFFIGFTYFICLSSYCERPLWKSPYGSYGTTGYNAAQYAGASTAATYSGINVLFNVDTLALSSSTSLA